MEELDTRRNPVISATSDTEYFFAEQRGCLFQPLTFPDKVAHRLIGELLHLAIEVNPADTHFPGYHFHIQFGIAQIAFVYHLHDAFHEFIIG